MKTVGSRYTDTTPCFRDRLCLSDEAGGLRTQLFLKVFIANVGFISWLGSWARSLLKFY